MIPDMQEVQDELGPHAQDVHECFRLGLDDYVKEYVSVRHVHSKRSASSLIHDHIVRRLLEKFGSLADAEGELALHKKGNLNQLIFKLGKYKLRIKKLGRNYKTRNIQTQTVIAFNQQSSQGSFEITPPPVNLYVGYLPRDDASLLSSEIVCICPDGKRVAWAWHLDGEPVSRVDNVRSLVEEAAPKRARRVKMRDTQADKGKKVEEDDAEGNSSGRPGNS